MKRHDISNEENTQGDVITTSAYHSIVSPNAIREGNVPGEYVLLLQQFRIIRPGRMLL